MRRFLSHFSSKDLGGFKILALLLFIALCMGSGCSGYSEDELDRLKEDNVALAAELEAEKKEAQILNQALTNVYKERDRLADLLNAASQPPPAEQDPTQSDGQAASQEGAQTRGVYLVVIGDTLGAIAQKHNTTTAVLLRLNPYLADRRGFMVWENDRILLPQ
ncbi:MAG: LysM peptidoglycan-binding domain-containing protein [Deltaproteobacteria bacterium]|jgi:LysM repeat protein|nr:LysM peptidoglycan-binding domain-containing protein [Deltaproteobacteria bacterium]